MKTFTTILTEIKEANKNMVKFIKSGNTEAAEMWAIKLQELENSI